MATGMGVSLRVTASCSQGGRRYMEDTFTVAYHPLGDGSVEYAYFGIFDGHGGEEASTFARIHLLNYIIAQEDFWSDEDSRIKRAIRKGFLDTHEAMWRDVGNWRKTPSGHTSTAGTTATICFVKKSKLYIGHVGDSGVVLGYKEKGEAEWRGKPLTRDHKPEDPEEYKRIERSGGKVQIKAGICRVVWNRSRVCHTGPVTRSAPPCEEIPFLAVARSLGDLWSFNPTSNTYVVSPDPDVIVLPLNVSVHHCLVFGTDGLWNVVTPDAAVAVIQTCEIHNSADVVLDGNPKPDFKKLGWINPARKLVDVALQRWSENQMRADNTSVIAVMLDHPLEEVKENCEHVETSNTQTAGASVSRKGPQQRCADGIRETDKNSRLPFATPGEWVGPPPVAARVKNEPSWSPVDGDVDASVVPPAVRDTSCVAEDTAGRVVKVGDSLCSDPVCLTIKDNCSVRRDETSLAAARVEEIKVCSDENKATTTTKQQVTTFPTCYTAKLENFCPDWQQTVTNSSLNNADNDTVLEGSRVEPLQKSKRNQLNDTEAVTSLLTCPNMRDHSNENVPFASNLLQQKWWARQSEDMSTVLSSHRSRWGKHSIKNMSSPVTVEHKRKRSHSDDRTLVLSRLMQKKSFKPQPNDILSDAGPPSPEKSSRKLCSDADTLKLPSCSVQEVCKKNSDDTVTTFTSKEKRIRSQSYDRKRVTTNFAQQEKCNGDAGDEPTMNVSQTQTRNSKRHIDSEQSFASASSSSQQQKRRRNLSEDTNGTSSVNQESSTKCQIDERLVATTKDGKRSWSKESVLRQSVASFPNQLRGRRSQSDNRKVITSSVILKRTRRSKSVDACRDISALNKDNSSKIDADDRQLLATSTTPQKRRKRRRRSQSHDTLCSSALQAATSLNHTSNDQLIISPHVNHKGIRRSKSLDGKTFTSSVMQRRDYRRHSVASQSLVMPVTQRNNWEQAIDRQTNVSFPYQQHSLGNESDNRHAVTSSRVKSGLSCSRNGHNCGKRWGKRRKMTSTHVGQLRRNAAVTRRRPSASLMVTSSRSVWPQNSSSDSHKATVGSVREPGRILRSVTAAVIAESLPIAKKLRSSSCQAQPKCHYGCGLTWRKVCDHCFTKRSNVHSRNVPSVCRYHFK
ncbi:uncharacterized protein LOC126418635 [Schistocerca serialis cubense]|uniref:uncharacterized protein LOC126418635 n=1 Tax=Schistocerca serialis cubense TaxID=2023355 RepID=UPI00214F2E47|nr:uncharacterized protein LOC126418635 [Schistocerca serialis cubense]